MVIDIRNRSHRPKGLPARVAGTYEPADAKAGDADLADAAGTSDGTTFVDSSQLVGRWYDGRRVRVPDTGRHPDTLPDGTPWNLGDIVDPSAVRSGNNAIRDQLYLQNRATRKGWEYAEELLSATRAGDGYDYRGEPVMNGEEELALARRAVIDDTDPDHPRWGPVMRAFAPFFPNRVECEEMARTWTQDALLAMRRSCAIDPTKAYTRAFAAHKILHEPIRVERILAREPFNLSAHRMRVGIRYGRKIDEYRAEHGGRLPDSRERDRLWDEAMTAFIREKTESGASYGRGMYYSDGHSADPRTDAYRTGRIRHYKPTGEPFNARKDYEGMLRRGREILAANDDFSIADASGRVDAKREGIAMEDVYRQALEKGLDTSILRKTLGIDPILARQWEEKYRRDA